MVMSRKIKVPKQLNKESFFRKYVVPSFALLFFLSSIFGIWSDIEFGYIRASVFFTSLKKIKPNDFPEQAIKSVEDKKKCEFDDSEWAPGYGGQLQKQEDGLYLLASTTQKSSLLLYERSISSKAEIFFSFVPLSGSSSNVTIVSHDLFEIVIGDEDSRRVTVKVNLIEGDSMSLISADNEDNKSFLLPQELIIGKEVIVKITQQPFLIDQYELILSITYDPMKNPVVKSYHFPIPPKFKVSDKPIRVSIGMINTNNKEDVLTRFKCFKISLSNLSPDLGQATHENRF